MIEVTHRANTSDVLTGRVTKQGAAELSIAAAGEEGNALILRLPSAWLSPAQMITWLESLALAAEELCEQIRIENDMPTIANTAHGGTVVAPLVSVDFNPESIRKAIRKAKRGGGDVA